MYGRDCKNPLTNRKDQYTKIETSVTKTLPTSHQVSPKIDNILPKAPETPRLDPWSLPKPHIDLSKVIELLVINNALLTETLERVKILENLMKINNSDIPNTSLISPVKIPDIITNKPMGFFSDSTSEETEPLNILTITTDALDSHVMMTADDKRPVITKSEPESQKITNSDIRSEPKKEIAFIPKPS